MGICESKNNYDDSSKTNKNFQHQENRNSLNESFKLNEINLKVYRIKECLIQFSPSFEKVNIIISNVSKSICKIKIGSNIGNITGTGFLLSFYIEQERFYCLVSNEHVIKKELLNTNIDIYILYDNEYRAKNINLNDNKRYMKSFIDIALDITIIEIIDEDNISKDYFLFPELEERIKNNLINNSIYIPQYPGGKELMNAKGKKKKLINLNLHI